MPENTQTADTPNTPTTYGYCRWHDGHAEGVRLIDVIEQGSRAGGALFACPPCRDTYHLVPFTDRP